MNYYKKYQKYKFKYLNLLNQSGGYTPEEFKQMLEEKNDEDLLEDTDPISLENIKVKDAVLINTQVYNVNYLFKWIKTKYNEDESPTIPLTNEKLKLEHFVDIKNKLFDEEKKNIIKKIIISKFKKNTQNLLNQLEPEQLDKIDFLNKFYIIWIQAVKLNWHVLKNIPANDPEITNEQYIEICELAVKQHSNALEFVKANAMKDEQYLEICKLAFRHKGFNTLQYVPNLKRTFKICELAVKNNPFALEYVLVNNMRIEQYSEICRIAIINNGIVLKYIPYNKKTYEICKLAVQNNGQALNSVSYYYKTFEMCKLAIQNDGFVLLNINLKHYVEITPKKYLKLCKLAVKQNGKVLQHVPEINKTLEICKIALQNNGFALEYVPELNKTLEICKIAVQNDGFALEYVPELNKTLEICKIAVQNDGFVLEYVPELNKTLEICKIAVQNNGFALVFVPELNKTLEICKIAVQKDGFALVYVPELNKTLEIYKIAVQNNGNSLKYIESDKITDEQYIEICEIAVKNDGLSLQYVPDDKKTPEICKKAIKHNGDALQYIFQSNIKKEQYLELYELAVQSKGKGNPLKYVPYKNRILNLYKLAIQSNGLSLEYIDPLFMINITDEEYYEICKTAIKQNSVALKFVFIEANKITHKQYYEICKIAVTNNSNTLQFVRANKITHEQYYEICKLTVTNNGNTLKYVQFYSDKTKPEEYYEICKLAVENNGFALEFVEFFLDYKQSPYNMKKEKYYEICELAVKNNGLALQHVPNLKKIFKICKLAVQNNVSALQYVLANNMKPIEYYEICQEALQHLNNLSNEDIYKIYLVAVKNDGTLLYYVNKLKSNITDDQYFKICKQAVQTSYWNAFNIVIADNMTLEQYYKICKLAVANYGTVLQYVNVNAKANKMTVEQYYKICILAVQSNGFALKFVKTEKNNDYQNYKICQEALQHLDNLSKEDIYETSLVAVKINGNLLYDVNKLILKFTYEQYFEICKQAIKKNREASSYIISKEDYNNLLSNKSRDQSGGANNNHNYNYDEFIKLKKKESENEEMFSYYKSLLDKIINEYTNNNKIDESNFQFIVYLALATGQDPSKVPILLEILKIITLDKDKQTSLLSKNINKRKQMLDEYSEKNVLTLIKKELKHFYDHYKKNEAYIQQRILKLDTEYRKKLLKFDIPEKIKYIVNNFSDDKIKELFDNSDLYDLYSLNILKLVNYLEKYRKKSSRIKKLNQKTSKKSSKKQVKKSSKKQVKKLNQKIKTNFII
jgi:hypothetical protein